MDTTSSAFRTISRGGKEPVSKVLPFFCAVYLPAVPGFRAHSHSLPARNAEQPNYVRARTVFTRWEVLGDETSRGRIS